MPALSLDDLVANGTMSRSIATTLRRAVEAHRSYLVIALPRLAGKSTVGKAMLEFARKKTVRQLKAEVDDARKKGRKNPRKDHYGLPALNVRMVFELKPDEHEILERALKKAAQEMETRLKGAKCCHS